MRKSCLTICFDNLTSNRNDKTPLPLKRGEVQLNTEKIMETVVLEKSGVITDMKSRVKDVMMAISWRDFANTYFHKSSSWFYHKMDGIDGNGGTGGFNAEEAELMRGALIDLSERIRRAAEEI